MVQKSKTREITITDDKGRFNVFWKRIYSDKQDYDFEGLAILRKILSNEKAKLMHTIKTKNPSSIYQLAKMVKRDFKSVSEDIKLLERFGFVDMVAEKTGKRERLKPVLSVDTINIVVRI